MTRIHPGLIGVAVLLVLAFTIWWHGVFIRECMASGNTQRYCEMQFWRNQ